MLRFLYCFRFAFPPQVESIYVFGNGWKGSSICTSNYYWAACGGQFLQGGEGSFQLVLRTDLDFDWERTRTYSVTLLAL